MAEDDVKNGKTGGASLESLGLSKESLEGTDFADIPENIGQSFPDPPQPGEYRMQLPTAAQMKLIWARVESQKYGERLNALFQDEAALLIVQSPGKAHDGESFRWRCSNVPRERTKEKILVSDMDLLLRGLGVTQRPKTNIDYAEALRAQAGKQFAATVTWSWSCNPKRNIYVEDGDGGTQEVEGTLGCGQRFYQRDIGKQPVNPEQPDGVKEYPLRITCGNPDCGASLRAFPNLEGFKK